MKENISYLMNRIQVEGTETEIKNLVYALDEIISNKTLKSEIDIMFEKLKKEDRTQELNLSSMDRVYLHRNSIIYLPNKDNQAFYFKIIKEKYDKAKELIKNTDSPDKTNVYINQK